MEGVKASLVLRAIGLLLTLRALPPTSQHDDILTGDERNAKLAVGSTWPGMGKVGRLVDFLCHLLVRGIEL